MEAHSNAVALATSITGLVRTLATVKHRAAVAKAITANALASGGKKNPAKIGDAVLEEPEGGDQVKLFAPILKAVDEKRTVTGVVLQPEEVDAQGDIISEEVIEAAAEEFLAKYNKATKLGYMHKNFSKKFELLQSYTAPSDIVLGTSLVKKGSWLIKVRVVDDGVWKQVKEGKITGFSIGGRARVVAEKKLEGGDASEG